MAMKLKNRFPLSLHRYCPGCGIPQVLPPLRIINEMVGIHEAFPEIVDAEMRCRSCRTRFKISEVA